VNLGSPTLLNCRQHPLIQGVLNVTPDSFFDGGQLYRSGRLDIDQVLHRVEQMHSEGVDIVDVGGESTRPGAASVSEQQELDRVIPVVAAIASRFDLPTSVDTSTAKVITESVAAGATMINDVRALRREGAIEAVVAADVPVCLMHMAGEPGDMQQNPEYSEVVDDVSQFLLQRVEVCERAGIRRERMLLDPGFGFGKNLQHNIDLFKGLSKIAELGFPLLVGVSRKSMIGAILDRGVEQRMVGSVALAMLAVQRGANILRVHDIAATRDALKMLAAVSEV